MDRWRDGLMRDRGRIARRNAHAAPATSRRGRRPAHDGRDVVFRGEASDGQERLADDGRGAAVSRALADGAVGPCLGCGSCRARRRLPSRRSIRTGLPEPLGHATHRRP
jgi:hypothetical protein